MNNLDFLNFNLQIFRHYLFLQVRDLIKKAVLKRLDLKMARVFDHDIMEVCSASGFKKIPIYVILYNKRRRA